MGVAPRFIGTAVTDLELTGHIGLDELGLAAERSEFVGQCLTGIRSAAGNDESAAGPLEGECCSAADARQRPVINTTGVAIAISLSSLTSLAVKPMRTQPFAACLEGFASGRRTSI
jgi:hypothetical protein